ncbi:YbbR-like [Syntrophomonas zehnderi OL-4]|uniref:YbbR-like n=1 Tax=Syntrophomonas zehnderi OL-4 TaxID=690567 RepID=A0A0E3W3I1_9FIRM|nr:CdaR family protein [Syntrophomonas zehnderi]CFX84483.1 YbbR-like [Syntrophomonas zehnderi OL-4]
MRDSRSRKKSIGLKALSLLMACMLWFYVVNQGGLASGKNIVEAELQYYNIPSGLTVVGPQTVSVKLWGVFRETGEIVAYVDLAGMEKGKHTLPVKVQPVKGAMLTTVQPDKVEVELEELREHLMPIKVEVIQNPSAGFELREVNISPDKCMVIGDPSVVNRIAVITAPVSLGDSKGISAYTVALEARDAQGNKISQGFSLLPEKVKAYVVVEPTQKQINVPIKPQIKGKPAEGYRVGEITVDPAMISLMGEKIRIDIITEVLTREIDISDKKESFVQAVDIIVPEGVTATPMQVNVKVTIEKVNDKVIQE